MRRAFITAALSLVAGIAHAEETLDYRGRSIHLGASPRAPACVDLLKKGIDLSETLPPKLRGLSQKVKTLWCNPLPSGATHTRAEDDITGIYVMQEDPAKSVIVFRRDPAYISAQNMTLSLVVNGIYAQRHRDLVEGKRQLTKSPDPALKVKVDRLEKIMTKSDMTLVMKAECEILDAQYGTMKALGSDPQDLSALSKFLLKRGCD